MRPSNSRWSDGEQVGQQCRPVTLPFRYRPVDADRRGAGLGRYGFARHLIVSALADIQQNTPRPVYLILTVSGSQVVDVMIDDPVAAIGNNAKEIE